MLVRRSDVCVSPGPEVQMPPGKGSLKACGLTAQENRGGRSCVNTPMHCSSRGQGSQAVGWCEDVLGVLMVEGQQHPEPGFLGLSHHFLLTQGWYPCHMSKKLPLPTQSTKH